MTYTLHCGDCLDILPTIPAQSVDAIIADPPYGATACKWDSVIPLEPMWRALKRVIKPRGAIVLFAAQPFTSALVMSNAGWFRQELTWDKVLPVGFLDANRRHLRRHENVLIFSGAGYTTFNPQKSQGKPYRKEGVYTSIYNEYAPMPGVNTTGERFPTSILQFTNADRRKGSHPTQKPVNLLRYLIRTYTNAGETVLDFTMGSGTTGVACAMEGRDFIGIELDAGYYEIARRRIESVQPSLLQAAD